MQNHQVRLLFLLLSLIGSAHASSINALGVWYSKPIYASVYAREMFYRLEFSPGESFSLTRLLIDAEATERTVIVADRKTGKYTMSDGQVNCRIDDIDLSFQLHPGADGTLVMSDTGMEAGPTTYFRDASAPWADAKVVEP